MAELSGLPPYVETIWTQSLSSQNVCTTNTKPKGPKLLGIELAPLNTPLKRRIQTFAITLWVTSFVLAPIILLWFIYLTLFTSYYWLPLMYFVWFLYDKETPHRGGRRLPWIRRLKVWTHYANYFPIRLVKTSDLDPSKNYLFSYHPHGVGSWGCCGGLGTDGADFNKIFPGLKPHLLTLEMNFKLPIFREYMMSLGYCTASPRSINYLLSHQDGGHVSVIVPGGAKESLDAHPGQECLLYLKERKGFVKMALKNGAPLVPVFGFGETEIMDQVANEEGSRVRKVQNWIQSVLGVAPILVLGRGVFQYSFGILPQRKPITVVVGSPVFCEKISQPTQQQVDHLHRKYVTSLVRLFDQYKGKYGRADSYIKII